MARHRLAEFLVLGSEVVFSRLAPVDLKELTYFDSRRAFVRPELKRLYHKCNLDERAHDWRPILRF